MSGLSRLNQDRRDGIKIAESKSSTPRLSRDLIRVCNLFTQHLDSSVGAFATTSISAHFAVLGLQSMHLLHMDLPQPAISIGEFVSRCFFPELQVW
jgi:hypothetical protein